MGTIAVRKRKGGGITYQAQILLKKDGKTVFREARSFDRKQAAAAWLERREAKLNAPGGVDRANKDDPALREIIDHYIEESRKKIGRTKAQ